MHDRFDFVDSFDLPSGQAWKMNFRCFSSAHKPDDGLDRKVASNGLGMPGMASASNRLESSRIASNGLGLESSRIVSNCLEWPRSRIVSNRLESPRQASRSLGKHFFCYGMCPKIASNGRGLELSRIASNGLEWHRQNIYLYSTCLWETSIKYITSPSRFLSR